MKAKNKLLTALVLFVGLLAVFSMAVFAAADTSPLVSLASSAGTFLASMSLIGNIGDLTDQYTFGRNITYEVYLIDINQVDRSVAFPRPNASREVGTIPLLTGEYMHYFVSHTNPTFLGNGQKGDVTSTGTATFTMIMAGNRDALLNFAESYIGGKFIIIFREIESDTKEILGSYERPVVLSAFENKNDADGRYVTYTFTRESVLQYYHYTGSLVTVPVATHTAGNSTLAIADGQDQYDIPNHTADYEITGFSGVTANAVGRIITLYGRGSTHPATIADGASFVLNEGTTWTAKAGSRISFRIYDTSTLVEVPGSRVQTA